MNRLTEIQNLLVAEEGGVLDGLECPDCHIHSVSVRYTQPAALIVFDSTTS